MTADRWLTGPLDPEATKSITVSRDELNDLINRRLVLSIEHRRDRGWRRWLRRLRRYV